ncbi:MAG TPA: hypothetical protein PLF13_08725 [candidate division Zixibacteria bacterium]|nr:hypothetical protein [candidate division Zixibacteria bacterium]
MRFRVSSLVLGLFALIIFAMAGCGDDETSTNSNLGSLSDPEFQAVQEQVESFVDSTLEFVGNGMNTLQGISTGDGTIIPAQYAVDPDGDDVVSVTYEQGWHVIYIAKHFTNYATSLRDSVQFIQNGNAQQSPTDCDSLVFVHRWDYDVVDTVSSHNILNGYSDYRFSGLDGGQATINGANDLAIHNKVVYNDSTVWRDLTIDAEVTNLTIDYSAYAGWGQCPVSGSVSATVDMTYQNGTNDPVNTEWTFTGNFTNGVMAVTATCNSVTWKYSKQICNVPQ